VTTLLTGGGARGREALDDDVDLARDRVLVTRAQGGDRDAFDDLYMRYYRRLYRFCLRRLHDAHEAEDVAQEAFARAWRALPTFGGDRRFYPWLSVIASHLCTDVLRRRNRSTPVAEFHQSNVASTEDGGEELMLAAVDSDLVAKAFTRLSDRHQRILHLREGSGWSYQRIADHEGVGITAVETLLWRARQALKREFATLAGADSRLGAWLGGAISLAGIKRLLALPARAMRRTTHTAGVQGAAVAAGSAVAATAMVIGAISSPATTSGSSDSRPRATFSQVPTTSLPISTPAAALSPPAGSADTGSGGSGSSGGGIGGTGLPSAPLPGGTGGAGIGGALQNAGGTLSTVGGNLQAGLNPLLAPIGLSAPVGTLLNGVTSTVNNLLGGAAPLLGAGTPSGSTPSGTSATPSGSSSPLGGTVTGVLGTVKSLLGGH
jgi:RNA polymerase sigma-70 factor (ECF subfamily)